MYRHNVTVEAHTRGVMCVVAVGVMAVVAAAIAAAAAVVAAAGRRLLRC